MKHAMKSKNCINMSTDILVIVIRLTKTRPGLLRPSGDRVII